MKKEFQETILEVEKILKAQMGTRDSDRALILQYMFENTKLKNLPLKTQHMITKAVYTEMPAFETITRCRRKLQAQGFYRSSIITKEGRAAKAKAMKAMFK